MKAIKPLVTVGVVGALVVSLAACGSKPGGSSASSDSSTATAWAQTDSSWDATRASFEKWNKENPDAQIKGEYFANDSYKEKIRTAVGSGNAPTLISSWGGSPVTDYVKNGNIVELPSELESVIKDKVFDSIVEGGYRDGKLYGVPCTQVQPDLLYVNKATLKAAGIDEVPTTWNGFLKAVAALKKAGKTPVALAGGSKWPYLMWAAYLIDRIGGPEVFQGVLDGKKDAWSDPAVTKAMTMIQDLVKSGAFGNSYQSMTADDKKDSAMVQTGQAGFVLQGAWAYGDMLKLSEQFVKTDLDFMPFPAIEGGKGDPNNLFGNLSNYWHISSKASQKQQKIAVDWLKSNTYSDDTIDTMLKAGSVPPVKGIEDKVKAADGPSGFYTWVYEAASKAPHYQLSWDVDLPAEQGQAVLNNLEQVFLLTQTPEQFAKNMNATIK
jgi:raffinose/stachyose/melibiose transport system substrate-binding protein